MKKLKVLDLFSGLGGFSLGLERTGHFETVAFCDNNKFSKAILNKHWKGIKIYDDVRAITKENFETDGIETPDIITGGFPCQPFSVAGKQKGTDDDRHLWPEMFRIIKVFQPKFVIGENVPGIVNIQDGVVFETVCTDLEDEGYEVQPFNIPAAAVGAPHQRKRIWFIAVKSDVGNSEHNGSLTSTIEGSFDKTSNNNEKRQNETIKFERTSKSRNSEDVANTNSGLHRGGRTVEPSRENGEGVLHFKEEEQAREHLRSETIGRSSIRGENKKLADTNGERLEGFGQSSRQLSKTFFATDSSEERQRTMDQGWWSVEPNVGRVANGVSGRVHRLRGLGNSIVPQIVEEIGKAIIEAERTD